MKKRIGMLLGVIAAAVIMGSSFGAQKVKAEELSLVGLSDELVRLYISSNNQLEVIDDTFIEGNLDTVQTCTVGNVTSLVSQFVYVHVSGFCNIRSGPSTNSSIVGRIYSGGVGTAVETSGDWTKIISGNVEGYIKTEFLTFGQEGMDKAAARSICRVNATSLKLRSAATTNSSIVYILPAFAELKIVEKTNASWYKVTYSTGYFTRTGYVSTEYITTGYTYAITKAKVDEISNPSLIANITWPYPQSYAIGADYGYWTNPVTGVYSRHSGVDIGGISGYPIVAALSGTVSMVSYNSSAGNYVEIKSADGVATQYLHCKNIYVYVGQTVSQGQTIAACGSTGAATGPHLHFSIFVNGSLVDPMDYLWRYESAIKWNCTRK